MNIERITEAAQIKHSLRSENAWLYLLKTFMGGIFIALGVIAAYSTAAIFYPINAGVALLSIAIVFPFALLAIVFLGGELFTSGVFVMSIGFYNKKLSLPDVLKIWGISFIGNFLIIAFVLALYCLTASYPKILPEFVASTLQPKFSYTIPQLLFKGTLCNFAVCCAYYASVRLNNEVCKFLMIFACIFAFVISGFEHSIANMGYFTIGFFLIEDFPVLSALRNIIFSGIGNIIGGAVILGLPVYLTERKH